MFLDSHSWIEHEFESHRQEWCCHFCADFSLSENAFKDHLASVHALKATSQQISILCRAAHRSKQEIGAIKCPVCDEWEKNLHEINPHIPEGHSVPVSREHYRKHVGRHMEQLALFAIPPHMNEAESDGPCGSHQAALARQTTKRRLIVSTGKMRKHRHLKI